MKKLLGILVLGLMLSGCATTVGDISIDNDKYNYFGLTHMHPACNTEGEGVVTGTKCFALFMGSFYTLGLYSPYYYDFYEYGDNEIEAEKKSKQACENFKKKKDWEGKAACTFASVTPTSKGEIEEMAKVEKEDKEKERIKLASMIDRAKSTCKTVGFKEGTEKFADCALKLYTQSVELAAEQNKTIVVQGQSSGSNTMTIYDPVRDSNAAIKRGQGLINGTCTLADLSTC